MIAIHLYGNSLLKLSKLIWTWWNDIGWLNLMELHIRMTCASVHFTNRGCGELEQKLGDRCLTVYIDKIDHRSYIIYHSSLNVTWSSQCFTRFWHHHTFAIGCRGRPQIRSFDMFWLDYFRFWYILWVQRIQAYSGNYTVVVSANILVCSTFQR